MTDENQVELPHSFVALFIDPGRSKPNSSREVITARYELCEDMASMLTEHARNVLFSLGITERLVLERILQGLTADGSGFNAKESVWVVRRLAELLDWKYAVPGGMNWQ